MLDKYDPEMLTFLLSSLKNGFLIFACSVTILGLYYFSRSWHSLWAILMLLGLVSGSFNRD